MTHLIQATDGSGVTTPLAVSGYSAEKAGRNTIHDTVDGGIGVAYRIAAPRSGTLTLVYTARADAWAAFTLLGRACPYLYTSDVDVVGMRFAVDGDLGIAPDPDVAGVWYVDVPYQEASA